MTGPAAPAMRDRLLALIRAYPGLHVRELARQLGTSSALVEYHLEALVRERLVRIETDEVYRRAYLAESSRSEPTPGERRALAVLRRRHPLSIVLHLLSSPGPQRHTDLAQALGLPKSGLSFHLKKLEEAGLVARTAEGLIGLADRRGVQRLLDRWKPVPDLLADVEELWDSLYG